MSTKTVTKLIAEIGFKADLKGLNDFDKGVKKTHGTLRALLRFNRKASKVFRVFTKHKLTGAAVALELFIKSIEKYIGRQAKVASQLQIQNDYYDIQQSKILGLSDAYKTLGLSMSLHLSTLAKFQNIQGGLALGKIPESKIIANTAAGAAGANQALLSGNLGEYEKEIHKRYEYLKKTHQNRRAFALRQANTGELKDYKQQEILARSAGYSQKQINNGNLSQITGKIAEHQASLATGGLNSGQQKEAYERFQRVALLIHNVLLSLQGWFFKLAQGFSKAFSVDLVQRFIANISKLSDTFHFLGEVLGLLFDLITGALNVFLTLLGSLQDLVESVAHTIERVITTVKKFLGIGSKKKENASYSTNTPTISEWWDKRHAPKPIKLGPQQQDVTAYTKANPLTILPNPNVAGATTHNNTTNHNNINISGNHNNPQEMGDIIAMHIGQANIASNNARAN